MAKSNLEKSIGFTRSPMPRKGTDLGVLQEQAEAAAKQFKAANTALNNAKAAATRAAEAHNLAQKALAIAVEQVQASTRVN